MRTNVDQDTFLVTIPAEIMPSAPRRWRSDSGHCGLKTGGDSGLFPSPLMVLTVERPTLWVVFIDFDLRSGRNLIMIERTLQKVLQKQLDKIPKGIAVLGPRQTGSNFMHGICRRSIPLGHRLIMNTFQTHLRYQSPLGKKRGRFWR